MEYIKVRTTLAGQRTMRVIDVTLMMDKTRGENEATQGSLTMTRLIAKAQAGDRQAFDRMMIEHQNRVVSLAWRLLGNREDALDAAQESFLRVYRHLHKYDPAHEFSAWLYRIVVNVCRDQARKRSRGNTSSLDEEFESGGLNEPVSSNNTESAAILAQERTLLAKALLTLTEKERQAIVLRDLEGLATDEVAELLGSSPTTVRSQISSARSKIRSFRERLLKRGSL